MAAFSTAATILGGLALAAGTGAVGYAGYNAVTGGGSKLPSMTQSPTAPSAESATSAARSEVEKRKRAIALSGGKTLLDSGSILNNTGTQRTLLGS